jgi:integrase/recombinase XerD
MQAGRLPIQDTTRPALRAKGRWRWPDEDGYQWRSYAAGIKDIAPYTGRHSVSTQLVMNGVHQFIKYQIMGHAKPTNDMSRHYTNVLRPQLLDAINTLPIIERWADAPWMKDPIAWASKLAEGTGKRNDLLMKQAV